jgi:hypothetical protein
VMLCGYFIRRRGKAWSFEFFSILRPAERWARRLFKD